MIFKICRVTTIQPRKTLIWYERRGDQKHERPPPGSPRELTAWSGPRRDRRAEVGGQDIRSTTWSMQAVKAVTSDGSTVG
jgi:hypothetical protein